MTGVSLRATMGRLLLVAAPLLGTTIARSEPVQLRIVGSDRTSVLAEGRSGEFHGQLNNLGAVIHQDGFYHMFYNDLQGGWPPAKILVGYATSSDGTNFNRQGTTGVLDDSGVDYVSSGLMAQSILVEDDGTWVMYFDTVSDRLIGRATAPGPAGPWTADRQPALRADPLGWDAHGIVAPSVVRHGSRYYMYYGVFGGPPAAENPHMAIGMATSQDGVTWTKYDDPSTTESPYQSSDPVFERGVEGAWDHHKVEVPRVFHTGEGFVMLYRSDSGHASWGVDSAYGLATSPDGVNWSRLQDEPVLSEDDAPSWATLWSAAATYHQNALHFWVETDGPPSFGTRINYASHSGPIPIARNGLAINQGLSGAWFDAAAPGQGLLLDVDPVTRFVFAAWFTYTPDAGGQRWLTAQGNFDREGLVLPVFETLGGQFNSQADLTTSEVGELRLSFQDCQTATADFELDAALLTGQMHLTRLLADAAVLCESLH